ncbi:PadR family transcriptional regulator [Bacillus cereus]
MKLKQIIHNLKVQLGEFRMSIRYALLGLLSKKEQTGYDLYHTFQEQLIYFWNSSHSQVYKELSKNGAG